MNPLADLNNRYTESAFRYEVLRPAPDYNAATPRTVHSDPYLRRAARHIVVDGKRRDRVIRVGSVVTHVMAEPLRQYEGNVTVGEDVVVSVRSIDDRPDYWLFDEDTEHAAVVVMRYDDSGHVIERELVTDPGKIAEHQRHAKEVRRGTTDLHEFLASLASSGVSCAG